MAHLSTETAADKLISEIKINHDHLNHPGPYRFCSKPLCKAAREALYGSA